MWVNRDLRSLTQPLPAAQEQHPDPCSQGPLMLQAHHTTEPWGQYAEQTREGLTRNCGTPGSTASLYRCALWLVTSKRAQLMSS